MKEELAALPGFSPRAIELAAMLLEGYGVAAWAPQASAILSAQMAFFFWLDDRFDGGALGTEAAVSVIDHLHGGAQTQRARDRDDAGDEGQRGPEAAGFSRIEAALWAHRPSFVRRARWRASAVSVVEAMLAESVIDARTTLSEYVIVGAATSTIGHLFATLAWHEDLSLDDAATATLIRRLALHARLHNDKHSIERDERESSRANAILVAGGGVAGRAAIERELARLEEGIGALSRDERVHERVRAMAPRMLATHEAFYRRAGDRYAKQAESLSAG